MPCMRQLFNEFVHLRLPFGVSLGILSELHDYSCCQRIPQRVSFRTTDPSRTTWSQLEIPIKGFIVTAVTNIHSRSSLVELIADRDIQYTDAENFQSATELPISVPGVY